jgi:hypothetical protein
MMSILTSKRDTVVRPSTNTDQSYRKNCRKNCRKKNRSPNTTGTTWTRCAKPTSIMSRRRQERTKCDEQRRRNWNEQRRRKMTTHMPPCQLPSLRIISAWFMVTRNSSSVFARLFDSWASWEFRCAWEWGQLCTRFGLASSTGVGAGVPV